MALQEHVVLLEQAVPVVYQVMLGTSGTYVSINAGTGLTGGGALSTDRTLSMNWNGTTNAGDMVTYNSGNPNSSKPI